MVGTGVRWWKTSLALPSSVPPACPGIRADNVKRWKCTSRKRPRSGEGKEGQLEDETVTMANVGEEEYSTKKKTNDHHALCPPLLIRFTPTPSARQWGNALGATGAAASLVPKKWALGVTKRLTKLGNVQLRSLCSLASRLHSFFFFGAVHTVEARPACHSPQRLLIGRKREREMTSPRDREDNIRKRRRELYKTRGTTAAARFPLFVSLCAAASIRASGSSVKRSTATSSQQYCFPCQQ